MENRVHIEPAGLGAEERQTSAEGAADILRAVLRWATQRCPCGPPDYEPDEPKICPLCLADRDDTVNGFCKSAESTIPPHLLRDMRRVLQVLP